MMGLVIIVKQTCETHGVTTGKLAYEGNDRAEAIVNIVQQERLEAQKEQTPVLLEINKKEGTVVSRKRMEGCGLVVTEFGFMAHPLEIDIDYYVDDEATPRRQEHFTAPFEDWEIFVTEVAQIDANIAKEDGSVVTFRRPSESQTEARFVGGSVYKVMRVVYTMVQPDPQIDEQKSPPDIRTVFRGKPASA